jgi:hypothetical protein
LESTGLDVLDIDDWIEGPFTDFESIIDSLTLDISGLPDVSQYLDTATYGDFFDFFSLDIIDGSFAGLFSGVAAIPPQIFADYNLPLDRSHLYGSGVTENEVLAASK